MDIHNKNLIANNSSSINCQFHNIQSFNSYFTDNDDGLFIVHVNIRSFNANFDELGARFSFESVWRETWLYNSFSVIDHFGSIIYW